MRCPSANKPAALAFMALQVIAADDATFSKVLKGIHRRAGAITEAFTLEGERQGLRIPMRKGSFRSKSDGSWKQHFFEQRFKSDATVERFTGVDDGYYYELAKGSNGWGGSRDDTIGADVNYSPLVFGFTLRGESFHDLWTHAIARSLQSTETSYVATFEAPVTGATARVLLTISRQAPWFASAYEASLKTAGNFEFLRLAMQVDEFDEALQLPVKSHLRVVSEGDDSTLHLDRTDGPISPVVYQDPMREFEGRVVQLPAQLVIPLGFDSSRRIRETDVAAAMKRLHVSRSSLPEASALAEGRECTAEFDAGCGAVATYLFLTTTGVEESFAEMIRRIPKESDQASSVESVVDVCRKYGINVSPRRVKLRELTSIKDPILLLLPRTSRDDHFVVAHRSEKNSLVLVDPPRPDTEMTAGDIDNDPRECIALLRENQIQRGGLRSGWFIAAAVAIGAMLVSLCVCKRRRHAMLLGVFCLCFSKCAKSVAETLGQFTEADRGIANIEYRLTIDGDTGSKWKLTSIKTSCSCIVPTLLSSPVQRGSSMEVATVSVARNSGKQWCQVEWRSKSSDSTVRWDRFPIDTGQVSGLYLTADRTRVQVPRDGVGKARLLCVAEKDSSPQFEVFVPKDAWYEARLGPVQPPGRFTRWSVELTIAARGGKEVDVSKQGVVVVRWKNPPTESSNEVRIDVEAAP